MTANKPVLGEVKVPGTPIRMTMTTVNTLDEDQKRSFVSRFLVSSDELYAMKRIT